jgi:hypothetical protein
VSFVVKSSGTNTSTLLINYLIFPVITSTKVGNTSTRESILSG